MTLEPNSGKRRRLLVAVDCNAESWTGLQRAAALASELRAELAGLFLEDVNLLRMSELPGHEISLVSGTGKATSRAEMERQMRRSANAARDEIERLARSFSLSWTFEVRRAGLDRALRDATKTEELVCGVLARSIAPTVSPPPARPVQRQALSSVLAVYEGGPNGARVLGLAVRSGKTLGLPLEVLVPAKGGDVGARAIEAARAALKEAGGTAALRRVPLSEAGLLSALAAARGQLLFLDAGGKAASAERLPGVRSAAKCDVLLVSSQ